MKKARVFKNPNYFKTDLFRFTCRRNYKKRIVLSAFYSLKNIQVNSIDYIVLSKEEVNKIDKAIELISEIIDKRNWRKNYYHLKQGNYKLDDFSTTTLNHVEYQKNIKTRLY